MGEFIITKSGRRIQLNSPEEDARITAAAEADPDSLPWSEGQLETARPLMRIGRPLGSGKKVHINIRFDRDVVEAFKTTGTGWQTRMNEVLRQYVQEHKLG